MSNTTSSNPASLRIANLLDEGSFVEIGGQVTARATDFNMQEKKAPTDGVITGYGVIDGNLVYVYSQDASVLNGTIGEMHAKKIANIYDMAMKMGAPVIGLIDCAGLRLQEATDALYAFGSFYYKQAMASGVIPQITAVYPKHYTTAYELAQIADYALENDKFAQIVKTQYATININGYSKELKNTNELLLGNIEGVYGVKTGFTNNAGRCLVTAVKRKNMDLIIVVLGADTRKYRAKDSLKLINYIYQNYRVENIEEQIQKQFDLWNEINKNRIYIYKGTKSIELELGKIKYEKIITNKQITIEINSLNYLEAPVEKGTVIGNLIVKNGGEIVETIDIKTAHEIRRKGIFDYLEMFAKIITQ